MDLNLLIHDHTVVFCDDVDKSRNSHGMFHFLFHTRTVGRAKDEVKTVSDGVDVKREARRMKGSV